MKDTKVIKTLFSLLNLYPWAIPKIVILGVLLSFFEGLEISLAYLCRCYKVGHKQTRNQQAAIFL
jgi:hypothetical protein